MSVVMALKYNGGVLLAADTQSTGGNIKNNNAVKIKKMKYSNVAIGTVGYLRDANIFEVTDEIVDFKDILDKIKIDKRYIINTIVPNIFKKMKEYNRLEIKNEVENLLSCFILVTPTGIFTIGTDGSVVESENFATVGCGDELVRGYLETISDINNLNEKEGINIIKNAIIKSCKNDIYINDMISILNIKNGGQNEEKI